jgi:hypothetical protein
VLGTEWAQARVPETTEHRRCQRGWWDWTSGSRLRVCEGLLANGGLHGGGVLRLMRPSQP